jgi:hypothetical protein
MLPPRTIFVLIAGFALGSCATKDRHSKDPLSVQREISKQLAARQKGYERLASFLEPGMTRRQVYALLPPYRPPTTFHYDARAQAYALVFAFPAPRGSQAESHPLDPDFEMEIDYILASETSPWPFVPRPPERKHGPDQTITPAIEFHFAPLKGPLVGGHTCETVRMSLRGPKNVTPPINEIDRLLFGRYRHLFTPKKVPSKENMDDRLLLRPTVRRVGSSSNYNSDSARSPSG